MRALRARVKAPQIAATACLLLFAFASESHARPPAVSSTTPQTRAWVSGGWDHTWLLEAGLARGFRLVDQLALSLNLTAGLPPIVSPLSGWRTNAGATLHYRGPVHLGVDASLQTGFSGTNDVTSSRVNWNVHGTVRPGVFGSFYAIGLEATVRTAVLGHVVHSDLVHSLFDDRGAESEAATTAPEDGWVLLPASSVRAGAFVGFLLLRRIGVFLHGGLDVTPQFQGAILVPMLGQLGFYSMLGGEIRW